VLHGSAWLVVAGSGRAGLGRARQGEEPLSRRIGLMVDCYGRARLGMARHGEARYGEDVFTFRKSLKNGFEAIRDFDSWCESVIDA
jgi:hypothetical protein